MVRICAQTRVLSQSSDDQQQDPDDHQAAGVLSFELLLAQSSQGLERDLEADQAEPGEGQIDLGAPAEAGEVGGAAVAVAHGLHCSDLGVA